MAAAQGLAQRGEKVTVTALAREAKVRKEVAGEWFGEVWQAGEQVAG